LLAVTENEQVNTSSFSTVNTVNAFLCALLYWFLLKVLTRMLFYWEWTSQRRQANKNYKKLKENLVTAAILFKLLESRVLQNSMI